MSKFNFKNHEVYYDVQGEGEPLVILNGIMMSTKSWEYLVPPVSKVTKLIRVDFFDQGQSDDYLDEPYTQDLQAELVLALLDHLNIEKTYIMGLSYGGEVAIKFALRHQERLLGLILSNTTSKTNEWLRDIGRGWNGIGEKLDGEAYYNIAIPVIYSPGFYQKNNDWMENRRKLLVPLF
jgi:pimeloyl-ACP methyl ester carboxylesterase